MLKLLVLPGYQDTLGGTTASLSLTIEGFKQCGASEQLCVLVKSNSLMERYLRQAGQASCIRLIQEREFMKHALHWVNQQPKDYPLLLENCVDLQMLLALALAAPALHLSGRPIYHVFRDHTRSYHPLGNLARKLAFACLSPRAICNSQFTAKYIRSLISDIQGILYPPVDIQQFNNRSSPGLPPANLQPILSSGAQLMLTPSRITAPGKVNDKNLRALPLVLAQLKSTGHNYHGVIIGEDASPNRTLTHELLQQAERLGVADRFTILPPTFAIADYYRYADVVVTLAPREPFGRTVVEAIACGVPVIGSKTGGIGEILSNFAPEWTVEPNDPVAAAEAIVRVAADSTTPNVLAQGRHWVETNCSTVSYARKIAEIVGLISTNSIETPISYSLNRG
jgi:glycosyltransferase involved in cell wall biosynthesis